MRSVSISDLELGMELAADIMSDVGITILAKGTVIADGHLDSLKRMGISSVFIRKSQQLEYIPVKRDYYLIALNEYKKIYMSARIGTQIDNIDYNGIITGLFNQYADTNDILGKIHCICLNDLYIYKHAINVSIIAMSIAKWLRFSKKEIIDIGIAGYLHDIGKCNVPGNILNKPERLVGEEFEIMKAHAKHSFEIVQDIDRLSHKAKESILFHHERMDGTGYPNHVRGAEIPLNGRILGIADTFDAILSDRVYSAKVSPYRAIEILKDESFGKLDPKIVNILTKNIADFYVGNTVKLSTGETGEVILLNKSNVTRPLIKINSDYFIDLSTNYHIQIVEVLRVEKTIRND